MIIKKLTLYLFCLLFPVIFYGQIRVSEHIQQSTIATQDENALYFVDFWATWCKPCIHVSKYLETLQKQYPSNFYVLSLTKENPDVVKRFMGKHKMDLAIAIDYEGETFLKNEITSLPYGILYNAYGVKLWEGHPAEFKTRHIDRFLRENKTKTAISEMVMLEAYKKAIVIEDVTPDDDFEIQEIEEHYEALHIKEYGDFIEFKGSLQDILAYSYNVSKKQISISSEINKFYKVRFNLGKKAYNKRVKLILRSLKLKQADRETSGDALVMDVVNPTFWDTNQINWGENTPHFLIGDSEIKADNVNLHQIKYQLSMVLDMPVMILNNKGIDSASLHDWDIHYRYFDLMVSVLSDTYGIEVKKQVVKFPEYIITKKRA
ncbi:TlpA disulfide reductase family protein [uncultured Algibacter sp.]|uniref:TlpA family protein disulfide reductase n=1 Tax=uncultured Algibacter sp. TaxID=298659 RepID=UPI00321634F3